jgi:hypothetical protein
MTSHEISADYSRSGLMEGSRNAQITKRVSATKEALGVFEKPWVFKA